MVQPGLEGDPRLPDSQPKVPSRASGFLERRGTRIPRGKVFPKEIPNLTSCFWLWGVDAPRGEKSWGGPPTSQVGPQGEGQSPEGSVCCGPGPSPGLPASCPASFSVEGSTVTWEAHGLML